uniref:Fatty acid desaturase 2 n=1 Tax=Saimiri boliviensis boliviensis TaxID=39432 RepID=A0A2K6UA42_SAIBB
MTREPPGCRRVNSLMLYTLRSITSHRSLYPERCATSSQKKKKKTLMPIVMKPC